MDTPESHYAKRDGFHIGYQVWGDGAPDILDLGCGAYISIDEAGEHSGWHRYVERIAECGRVIRFDSTPRAHRVVDHRQRNSPVSASR